MLQSLFLGGVRAFGGREERKLRPGAFAKSPDALRKIATAILHAAGGLPSLTFPMKIGFNLLLWTGHVTEANFPILKKLKATGYDGVEIPIFDTSDAEHFSKIGKVIKDEGLECTAVTILPDEPHNAI